MNHRLWSPQSWPVAVFYVIAVSWIMLLCAVAVVYSITPLPMWLWHPEFGFTALLPLWVPWGGALGGATISLVGVSAHAGDWQGRLAFWHLARPALGAVFGVFGVAAVVFVLESISPSATEGSSYTARGTAVLTVIAFVLGYREETFRTLVKRLVDTVFLPADTPAGH